MVSVNIELLRNVRDAIGADVQRFEMLDWISKPVRNKRLDDPECGTAGCLAGHIVFEGAKLGLVRGTVVDSCLVQLDENDSQRVLSDVALDLLDTEGDSSWRALFGISSWPKHYTKDMNENSEHGLPDRAWQAKMAMELIDDILDGLTVWDEDRDQWVYLPDDATAEDESDD